MPGKSVQIFRCLIEKNVGIDINLKNPSYLCLICTVRFMRHFDCVLTCYYHVLSPTGTFTYPHTGSYCPLFYHCSIFYIAHVTSEPVFEFLSSPFCLVDDPFYFLSHRHPKFCLFKYTVIHYNYVL